MRILVLGYSSIVKRRVLPALAALEAISRIDIASRSQKAPKQWPKQGVFFANYQDALKESSAEVIYISLPNVMHEQWIMMALADGRHVVVDKPATLNLETARQCLDEAQRRDRLLAEATVFSYHPHIAALSEFFTLDNPITHIDAQFIIPPLPVQNFRNRRELGGGCFNDMSSYAAAISRVLHLKVPTAIYAQSGPRHGVTEIDLGFSLLAGFSEGARFIGHFSFESEYQNRLTIVSHESSVSIERVFSPPPDYEMIWQIRRGNNASEQKFEGSDTFLNFLETMVQSIRENDFEQFASDMIMDAEVRQRLANQLVSRQG